MQTAIHGHDRFFLFVFFFIIGIALHIYIISFLLNICKRAGACEFINYNDESISIHLDRYHLCYHILWVIKSVRARELFFFSILLFSFIDFTLYVIHAHSELKKRSTIYTGMPMIKTKVFDGKSIQFT